MNKREFLDELRERLSYDLPAQIVNDKIQFYEDYINDQARNGKSVTEVIKDLGDPLLIARTIVDSIKCGADGIPNTEDDVDYRQEIYGNDDAYGQSSFGGQNSYGRQTYSEDGSPSGDDRSPQSRGRGKGILIFLLVVFFIFVLISVVGTLFGLFMPMLMPFFMIMFIIWIFRRRG